MVFGLKTVVRQIGYVADYCPVCRSVESFKLVRLGMSPHIFFLTVSQGDLVGYERTCQKCRAVYETNIERYKDAEQDDLPLPELIQSTYPNVNDMYQTQLAFDEQLCFNASSLTSEERMRLIKNTLTFLYLKLTRHFEQTFFDGLTWIAAGVLFLVCLLVAMLIMRSGISSDIREPLILFVFVLGLVGVIGVGAGARSRYIKREIMPVIYRALHVIKPTEDELAEALFSLKNSGYTSMALIKQKELVNAFRV